MGLMGIAAVFRGGSMNGTGITYQPGCGPEDKDTVIIRETMRSGEAYQFVASLSSWVYDHEYKVVKEE